MAIGGAFLGGGVELVPAGSCKLELEILTEDRANLTATFTIKGTSTYTVTAGADGRAVYTVPAGQTYTVSVNATGYDNIASQTVIAESGTVRYVRFEAIAGRVKRSGDTMTGILFLQKTAYPQLILKATNGVLGNNTAIELGAYETDLGDGIRRSQLRTVKRADDSTQVIIRSYSTDSNGKEITKDITLMNMPDGTAYVTAPSWSVGTNDNSDKILTIKMANSLPSLVHTTGNEVISGQKTFTGELVSKGGLEIINPLPYIDFHHGESTQDYTSRLINGADGLLTIDVKTDDLSKTVYMNFVANDGVIVIPSTPGHVTGNQIATADWSISKFQRKITYGTGNPPSGGQAGDIYIKI